MIMMDVGRKEIGTIKIGRLRGVCGFVSVQTTVLSQSSNTERCETSEGMLVVNWIYPWNVLGSRLSSFYNEEGGLENLLPNWQ